MAWETRGQRSYYYRKYRDGSKVKSEYVGPGVAGEMAEKLDLEEKQRKDQKAKQERELIKTMNEYFDSIESVMDPVEDETTWQRRIKRHLIIFEKATQISILNKR